MDIKNTLIEARHEIVALRRRNEILAAKVETMELFASVHHRTLPFSQPNTMASDDVVYALECAIDKLNQAELPRSAS